jgi:hypothetical protein
MQTARDTRVVRPVGSDRIFRGKPKWHLNHALMFTAVRVCLQDHLHYHHHNHNYYYETHHNVHYYHYNHYLNYRPYHHNIHYDHHEHHHCFDFFINLRFIRSPWTLYRHDTDRFVEYVTEKPEFLPHALTSNNKTQHLKNTKQKFQ